MRPNSATHSAESSVAFELERHDQGSFPMLKDFERIKGDALFSCTNVAGQVSSFYVGLARLVALYKVQR
jgi:hypothetical protein